MPEPANSHTPWHTIATKLERPGVDRAYELWIDLPPKFDPEHEGYPLIVCLDALWTFGSAVDAARILGLGKQLPRAIVAGVAHTDADLKQVVQDRAMDFTITAVASPPMTGVRVPAEQLGGAEAFRVWLGEIVDGIRADYPVSKVILVGHSFSALFGLHTLFTAAGSYDGYLLASPSVWWDDQIMFRLEAEFAEANGDLAAKVFMSKGSDETDEWSPHQEFHDQLASRGHPSLDLTWKVFDDENHSSVVSVAVNRGLRVLLGD